MRSPLGALALASFFAARAEAAQGEAEIAVEAGAAFGDHAAGASAELGFAYGLLESIALTTTMQATPTWSAADVSLGVRAAFDVLRTVPFAEVAAVLGLREPAFGVRLGIGADYFLSADLTLGVVVRFEPELVREARVDTHARLTYRFDLD